MRDEMQERAIMLGEYILSTGATVRAAAKEFHISKSTVHKDVSQRLERIDRPLFLEVKKILEKNLRERHIRGGLATQQKYQVLRSKKEK